MPDVRPKSEKLVNDGSMVVPPEGYALVPGCKVNLVMESSFTVPYTVEVATFTPSATTAAGKEVSDDTTISVTFVVAVALVAVTVEPETVPVVKPVVNVPLKEPSALLVGLAAMAAAADMFEVKDA